MSIADGPSCRGIFDGVGIGTGIVNNALPKGEGGRKEREVQRYF